MARTGETNWPSNCLFHYTEAAYADDIAADGYFEVGPGSNFGFGLYATDLPPHEAMPDEIRAVCFEGDAATNIFDGVLVLKRNDPQSRFIEVDRRVFLLPARDGFGEMISLHRILVGVGKRGLNGHWELSSWA